MNSRLRILLIVSLVLNVFVIGGLAGAALMWRRVEAARPLAGAGRPARLRQAAGALSPEDRQMLLQSVREAARTLRPDAQRARAARLEAARLLVQPDFDRAAFEAALADARGADIAIRARLEGAVVETAARLPQDERRKLAEGLDRFGVMRQPRPQR